MSQPQTAVAREPEIPAYIRRLTNVVNELHDEILLLVERLNYVSSAALPTAIGTNKEEETNTLLAVELNKITNIALESRSAVRTILETLEI